MSDVGELQASMRYKQAELSRVQSERDGYLAYAREIREAYERLARDKCDMIGQLSNVKSMAHDTYATFRGANFRASFQAPAATLAGAYDVVVSRIDANMDALNSLCAQYENKAYQFDGVIGYLRSAINYLAHEIENAFN